MFGRGIPLKKSRVLIEIAVIQSVDDTVHLFFKDFKINPHAQLIKLMSPDRHLDFPVVPVGLFASTRVLAQMMTT